MPGTELNTYHFDQCHSKAVWHGIQQPDPQPGILWPYVPAGSHVAFGILAWPLRSPGLSAQKDLHTGSEMRKAGGTQDDDA